MPSVERLLSRNPAGIMNHDNISTWPPPTIMSPDPTTSGSRSQMEGKRAVGSVSLQRWYAPPAIHFCEI